MSKKKPKPEPGHVCTYVYAGMELKRPSKGKTELGVALVAYRCECGAAENRVVSSEVAHEIRAKAVEMLPLRFAKVL